MSDTIGKEAFKKLTPSILSNMGVGLANKMPEVLEAITPLLAKKEIMISNISKELLPVLGNATSKFIDYLKEANGIAVQLELNNYELISNVIFENPNMSFDEKKELVLILKDENRKDKNQRNKFLLGLFGILGAVGSAFAVGPKFIDKHYDYKKTKKIQEEKTKRIETLMPWSKKNKD